MNNMLWLVYWQEYDEITPLSVYSSKEAAEKAIEGLPEPFNGSFRIEPVEDKQ